MATRGRFLFTGVTMHTHPPGFVNPVEMRASAALALAGAWDAAPTEVFCSQADNVAFAFTYTRGAAGGAFDWQIETSLYAVAANVPAGAEEWQTETVIAVGAVVAGVDTTNLVQRGLQSYTSQGAAAEAPGYGPIVLSGVIERIRVRARESGVVGNPGTLQIEAVFK